MEIPKRFCNETSWIMVQLSKFLHDDVKIPGGQSIIRLFPTYEEAIDSINNLTDKYGQAEMHIFKCEPPISEMITRELIGEKTRWYYHVDYSWASITHQDMIGSLNDRLWSILESGKLDYEGEEENA